MKLLIIITLLFSPSLQANDNFQRLKATVDARDLRELESLLKDPSMDLDARELSRDSESFGKGITILHYLMQDGEFLRDAPWVFMAFLDALRYSGIDVNARHLSGRTPLHFAAQYLGRYKGGRYVIKRLLGHSGIKPNSKIPSVQEAALHVAVRHASDPGFVEEFLDNPEVEVNIENKLKETPVMVAALFSKSPDVIRAVIYHDRVDLEVEDVFAYVVYDKLRTNVGIPKEIKTILLEELVQEGGRRYQLKKGCYGS